LGAQSTVSFTMTAWRQRRPGRLDTHKLYSVYGYSLQLRAARDGDPVRASKVVANAVYGKRGESMIIGPFREYSRKNTQPAFIQEMRGTIDLVTYGVDAPTLIPSESAPGIGARVYSLISETQRFQYCYSGSRLVRGTLGSIMYRV
jgi:hypothetical protein